VDVEARTDLTGLGTATVFHTQLVAASVEDVAVGGELQAPRCLDVFGFFFQCRLPSESCHRPVQPFELPLGILDQPVRVRGGRGTSSYGDFTLAEGARVGEPPVVDPLIPAI
jgi:hypothetical protein